MSVSSFIHAYYTTHNSEHQNTTTRHKTALQPISGYVVAFHKDASVLIVEGYCPRHTETKYPNLRALECVRDLLGIHNDDIRIEVGKSEETVCYYYGMFKGAADQMSRVSKKMRDAGWSCTYRARDIRPGSVLVYSVADTFDMQTLNHLMSAELAERVQCECTPGVLTVTVLNAISVVDITKLEQCLGA